MKYRNVLAATALIGMMAVTGCSRGALPENNEANYNGERLVRSVTRNADRMDGIDGVNGNRTRGFTRGLSRDTAPRTTDLNRTTPNAANRGFNRAFSQDFNRDIEFDNARDAYERDMANFEESPGRNPVNPANANRNPANRNNRGLSRNYVSDRAHRVGPNIALNDRALEHADTTVPVIAQENNVPAPTAQPAKKGPAAHNS